jgi:hypothetical protein
MAVCDGIRQSDSEAGVFNLKGVRQGILADAFPFRPQRLRLFLVLSSARVGKFPGYILIVNRTNKANCYAHAEPSPEFEANYDFCIIHMPIYSVFPEAGRYSLQMWFFQEQSSDVLKAEQPCFVSISKNVS